jgi:putative oxidoreductase
LIRIITGFFLAYHGWEVFDRTKMQVYLDWDQFKDSSGVFMAYLGKGAELVAGILLGLGLLTRLGSLITAGTMLYVSCFVGKGEIWYGDQYPFLFVLLGLIFFFTGPGKYSFDYLLFNKNKV